MRMPDGFLHCAEVLIVAGLVLREERYRGVSQVQKMNTMIFTQEYAQSVGVEVSREEARDFTIFADMLAEWNKKINLTAITDPKEVAIKHFTDSLSVLPIIRNKNNISLIDIGSGAGFPGIPLAIMKPDMKVTLLDSLNKRVIFQETVIRELGLQNRVTAIHGRAEELGRRQEYREQFDYAVARAVTNLSALCEYALPLVKVDGTLIAMKGKEVAEEISAAQRAAEELSGRISSIEHIKLPDGSDRNLIIIKKISQTSPKYPRTSTKISKNPL